MDAAAAEPVTVEKIRNFFARSDWLDRNVLRPLSHIRPHWDITWDPVEQRYEPEDDSFAEDLNILIGQLAAASPPTRYHDNEDALANYVAEHSNGAIRKENGRWIGSDYKSILEQGGFKDIDQKELISAASGRIHAAIKRQQMRFDVMEEGHQRILAGVLTIILYHRSNELFDED